MHRMRAKLWGLVRTNHGSTVEPLSITPESFITIDNMIKQWVHPSDILNNQQWLSKFYNNVHVEYV